MINKDLGLFAYDSTNRETISAKRIENKDLLICKYLPSSLSSIISDIFTRISCLYRSFDISWKYLLIKRHITFLYLSALSGPHGRRMEFFSIHESLRNRGNKYR